MVPTSRNICTNGRFPNQSQKKHSFLVSVTHTFIHKYLLCIQASILILKCILNYIHTRYKIPSQVFTNKIIWVIPEYKAAKHTWSTVLHCFPRSHFLSYPVSAFLPPFSPPSRINSKSQSVAQLTPCLNPGLFTSKAPFCSSLSLHPFLEGSLQCHFFHEDFSG